MCEVEYEPIPGLVVNSPPSWEVSKEFLIERYWLYAVRGSQLCWARVHHAPYQIESAQVTSLTQTLTDAATGITVPDCEPLVHFTREILADIRSH